MAFDNVRLHDKYSRGARGGPRFRTEVVVTGGGHESRNIVWSTPLARWNIGHLIKTLADFEGMIAFFYARQGRARGFRFKDWLDFQVTDGVIIASAAGGETSAQLVKIYTSGAVSFVRIITKPVSGTVSAKKNGSPFTVTPDFNTGIITFAALSASDQLTATFEFDVPVRFDSDDADWEYPGLNRRNWPTIVLTETRDIA